MDPEKNEPTPTPTDGDGASAGTEPAPRLGTDASEIFAKLDEIAEKRAESIAKKALEANGYQDDDLKGLLSGYRDHRSSKSQEQAQALETLEKENEELKAATVQAKMDAAVASAATALGITVDRTAYVVKMADLSKAVSKDGTVSAEQVSKALEKVLEDIPELKGEAAGGFKVGASDERGKPDDVMNTLLKAAGVKPKEGS